MKTPDPYRKEKDIFAMVMAVVFILFVGFIIFYAIPQADKIGRKDFQDFYQTTINGRLVYVEGFAPGTFFAIKGDSKKYLFNPRTNALNDNHIFSETAKYGDTIYKRAFSDTLYLRSKGKLYLYTFRKPKTK